MFEYGVGRGFMDDTNAVKALADNEGVWVKIIAITKDKTKAIGIMMNTMLSKKYIWGDMVYLTSYNDRTIPIITKRVTKIPNNDKWKILQEMDVN